MKKDTAPSVPVTLVNLNTKAVLKVSDEFNKKVKYLCSRINSVEWSGILFYESTGDLKEEQGIEIKLVDIYLMDKGSTGATEYDYEQEVMDYYDEYPDRFGMKYGHIHSHNHMQVFFSGIDMQELKDNAGNHSYYVSVVVNNANDIIGKIAIRGQKVMKSKSTFSLKGLLGRIVNYEKEEDKVEEILYTVDLVVEKEPSAEQPKSFFEKRVDEIVNRPSRTVFQGGMQGMQATIPFAFQQREAERQKYIPSYPKGNTNSTGSLNNLVPSGSSVELESGAAGKILRKALGGDFYDNIPLKELLKGIEDDCTLSETPDLREYLASMLDIDNITTLMEDVVEGTGVDIDVDTLLQMYRSMRTIMQAYASTRYARIARISNYILEDAIQELVADSQEVEDER